VVVVVVVVVVVGDHNDIIMMDIHRHGRILYQSYEVTQSLTIDASCY